jgi:subtilase family serine protease
MTNKYPLIYVSIAAALATLPATVLAQAASATADLNTTEMPRVTQAVNNGAVSIVGNSHLKFISSAKPTASVPDSMRMNHMQLILQRSALRTSALESLITAQHDPASSKFQQWVTPAQFGESFGIADADIAAVKSWLTSQGFTVNGVYPNKMQIDFSGTAGQVRQAFHTQENHYTISKVSHIANASDISVPSALRSVVVGVAGLNDFRPQPMHVPPQVAQFDAAKHNFKAKQTSASNSGFAAKPALQFNSSLRGFVPNDMNVIYNTTSLYSSGLTGTGITIAVVEDQDMDVSDWPNFVTQFSLGGYGGTFNQFQPQLTPSTGNCTDPGGASPGGESIETVLDAEWSTAMAPSAHIWVATCDDSDTSNFFGGVFTAADNLINGSSRPNVISASYGFGEGFTDTASKTAIDLMWAQADAEGISVFVSTGDSGSNPSFNGSIINGYGIDANSFATSPNDTGVGGTDTADILDGTTSTYFRSTPNSLYGTALSYVPELTWNTSCGNTLAAKSMGFATALQFCKKQLKSDPFGFTIGSEGGSGGPSSVDPKPAWQRQVLGAAKDQSRDLPDISLFGGSYGGVSWVILCTGAYPCTPNFTSPVELVAGTSLSSPMFAGVQALIDQGLHNAGLSANQGNAAPTLYALATKEFRSSLAACNADNGPKGTSACVFHNIRSGGNSAGCVQVAEFDQITPDCFFYATVPNFEDAVGPTLVGLTSQSTSTYNNTTSAFAAQPGWNFANGLGTVNANNLLAAWKKFVHLP